SRSAWCYDEHGGYYDHVPPPSAEPPDGIPARNWQLDMPPLLRWLVIQLPYMRSELAHSWRPRCSQPQQAASSARSTRASGLRSQVRLRGAR
ncbi:MAG TPA: alkaline phosphatase family protein, partial [Trebonia sp.]